MKVSKKFIFFTLLFIVITGLAYIIASTFFSSTLNFKNFYKSDELDINITYELDKNDKIIFLKEYEDNFKISLITNNNVNEKELMEIKINEKIINYEFFRKYDYFYLILNNYSLIYQIDIDNLTYKNYELATGKLVIRPNNSLYLYNDYSLKNLENTDNYKINNEIKDIKNIEFYDNNNLLIATYNSTLYSYSLINSTKTLLTNNYFDYLISDNNYLYLAKGDNKLNIYYSLIDTSFEIKQLDYNLLKINADYLYLINDNEIYKISLARLKQNETLEISSYANMSFSLNNILIINENLMYLPMVKDIDNYDGTNSSLSYLYRYKKKF